MVHIGIDIGTSNTVVALANPGGEPEVRRIKDNALVPSLIAVAEQGGHVMAGVDAVDEWANSDQESVGIFRRWKLRMGEGEVLRTMRFGGAASTPMEITPEWLTTRLVEHVLSEVAGGVGGETVDSVLITVPHGWRRDSPEKCQATRQAAASAIVNGKNPPQLTAKKLMRLTPQIPVDWAEQRKLLGFQQRLVTGSVGQPLPR